MMLQKPFGSLLALLLIAFFARSQPAPAAAEPPSPAGNPQIASEVLQVIAAKGEARVLITLTTPDAVPQPAQISAVQDELLARLPPGGLVVKRRYEMLPALAGMLSQEGLAALTTDSVVSRVQLDAQGTGHLAQSVAALGADVVHEEYGLTGAGTRIAVIDTGIDTDHPDLVADIVAQRCFTDGDCTPNGADVGLSAEDEHGHGTNVSGIITADGQISSLGFAPDAEIVGIRVLNEANWGWLSDWVAGLDWILANQSTLQVDVVNMSLGTVALYEGNCDGDWPIMADAVARLGQIGVPVFASSGNQGAPAAMGSPACNQEVIAVGATYDGNLGRQPSSGTYKSWFGGLWPACYDGVTNLQTITCFTNGGEMLDLAAPGMWITASGIGGGLSTYAGTSQASPTAASIAVLLLQANESLTPAQIQTLLRTGGTTVIDSKNGRPVVAINALAAVEALEPVAPQALTVTAPALLVPGVSYPFTAVVTPTYVTQPLTYTWEITGQMPIVNSNGHNDTIFLQWPDLGARRVQVTAINGLGEAAAYVDVEVTAGHVLWLPRLSGGG